MNKRKNFVVSFEFRGSLGFGLEFLVLNVLLAIAKPETSSPKQETSNFKLKILN